MAVQLTATELRVLGCLVEKELTTPDYYPLTLAALVSACNQKTNRDPVTALGEADVTAALQRLIRDGLARERNPAGSRVSKFGHRLGDSLGLNFGFSRAQLAVLAVLMLRGRQTPGELKTRSERLRGPGGPDDVESILASLITHDRGPWVRELPREPGKRESRWMHLMGEAAPAPADVRAQAPGVPDPVPAPTAPRPEAPETEDGERLGRLEETITGLRQEVETLRRRVAALEQGPPAEE